MWQLGVTPNTHTLITPITEQDNLRSPQPPGAPPGSYPFCSISPHPQCLTRAGQHFPGTGLEWSSVCGYTLLNMLYPYPSLLYG